MGKLMGTLQLQLKTEYKQDAEDCITIYNHLKDTTEHVWESEWSPLVNTIFEGWSKGRFQLTPIGQTFLQGLKNKQDMENFTHYRLYNHNTGDILYLMSISDELDFNHQESLEEKKVSIGYQKNIDHNDMSWETIL